MMAIMMKRRANTDSIPTDLIPEILSRLPGKSVARFRCVSKLWESIICHLDFTELFHTMSSSNPRLLIGIAKTDEWSFLSSPQPHNNYGKSSLVVAADFHAKFFVDCTPYIFSYASGLFYFTKVYGDHVVREIFNPSTGQHAILPPAPNRYLGGYPDGYPCGVLGFDPIGKQFKVLVLSEIVYDVLVYQILTLGTEKARWREIKCTSTYAGAYSSGICINGVLYYRLYNNDQECYLIGCFDVRSEKFNFLHVDLDMLDCFQNLINYKGKLCVSKLEYGHNGGFPHKLRMRVLEDVEKGEWSAYDYTLSDKDKFVKVNKDLFVVGATASGEIVLAKTYSYKPFYVFYFNPDKNALLSVEIQGVREENHRVHCFVDHVEDLNFDLMKTTYAATSIRPPEQSTSTSSREDHQERTVAHLQQDG